MVRYPEGVNINVNKEGFADFDRIEETPNIAYRVIYGGRSRGKTFQGLTRLIECVANGECFCYIRREHTMIVEKKLQTLFQKHTELCTNYLGGTIEYSARKGFYLLTADGQSKHIGDAYAVEDAFDVKGLSAIYSVAYFDEFMDYQYFPDETERFLHLMSSLSRNGTSPLRVVYMSANTVAGGRDNPYFRLFGYDWRKAKQGSVALIYHRRGASISIQYDFIPKGERERMEDKFIGFDSSESVSMIMFGEWESPNVECNGIDGITWNSMRDRLPFVISNAGVCYEISITRGANPVVFCRQLNVTTYIGQWCRFHFNGGMDLKLATRQSIVPTYKKVIKELPPDILAKWQKMCDLISAGRIVFDKPISAGDLFGALRRITE